jgi:3-hydroxybutyryl-CoA dehydrogenase
VTGVPERVGVLGGGTMGAGIAHAFLMAGAEVIVVERDAGLATAAQSRVEGMLAASVERGKTPMSTAITTGVAVEGFAGCGLVVEAVPEVPELKIDALVRIEATIEPGSAIASNTSSISIDTLAAALSRPADFFGLHFFNPVPASALVEIVLGAATAEAWAGTAAGWVTELGKTPITVHDAPGFASSRLGVAIGLEAIRMLEQGVASAEDIDTAMTLGYKHPVGPLRLTDLVGLDVRLGIAEYLHAELGDRFEPPALLRQLVAEGKLGRKTGQGFFTWDSAH